MNIIKISFLLQYRCIFPNTILRCICRWGLVATVVWTVIQQVILSLTCTPLDLIVPSTKTWCLDTLPIWVFTSIVSLVTDFAIFLLPIPWIWDLQMPIRQKLILFGIFGLGLVYDVIHSTTQDMHPFPRHNNSISVRWIKELTFPPSLLPSVCAISIIRVPTLRAAAEASDPTYENMCASLWTVAEINAAIICSSLPTLRPLVFKMSSNLTNMTHKTMTRTNTAPVDFPSSHLGHQLEDMPHYYKETINRVSRKEANGSSDDLVMSATYDEMMYGRGLPRQGDNTLDGQRRQSFHTATASDGNISVELGMPNIPKHDG